MATVTITKRPKNGPIYRYRDFVTGKPRWTRGTFGGFIVCEMGIRRAVFHLWTGTLFVPEYCLEEKTLELCEQQHTQMRSAEQ